MDTRTNVESILLRPKDTFDEKKSWTEKQFDFPKPHTVFYPRNPPPLPIDTRIVVLNKNMTQ
jgi:hypothetical protein